MILIILAGFVLAAAWLSLAGFGAMIIYRGFHGQFIDHNLRCHGCGYPLVGRRTLPRLCSECGLAIGGPKAYKPAPRRRRWRLIAIGAAMLLVCAAPLALMYGPALAKTVTATTAKTAKTTTTAKSAPTARSGKASPAEIATQRTRSPRPVAVETRSLELVHTPGPLECAACGARHGEVDLGFRRPAAPLAASTERATNEGAARPSSTNDPPTVAAPTPPRPRAVATWKNLRHVNGCCPHCGYPVTTPSKTTECGRCGVDLEVARRPAGG